MKGTIIKKSAITGTDQRILNEDSTASEIRNFRTGDDGGWSNDVGWESWIPLSSTEVILESDIEGLTAPTTGLWVLSRRSGAEVYHIYERAGSLKYSFRNKGLATSGDVILASGRAIPKGSDPGTQLINFGRASVFINGIDPAIKFWGRSLIEPFSWNSYPPPLIPCTPQPECIEAGKTVKIEPGASAIVFDKGSYIGLGYADSGSYNTYTWAVAFISNTGSISPPSPSTTISWKIANAAQEGHFAVPLSAIPIGPPGTVGRLILRSKNKEDGIAGSLGSLYEVTRIMDNVTTDWIDVIPDAELSLDPFDLDSSSPISPDYKIGASWGSSLWLAGSTSNPTKIIYSKGGAPEQFPTANYIDVGVRSGGGVTALIPYYNSLLVFRESSIDVIRMVSGIPVASTLDGDIGTKATNAITTVPGLGVVFLTTSGPYLLSGGLDGGSEHSIKPMAPSLSEEWKRLNVFSMAKATSAWSQKEGELWIHYPADGKIYPIRGAVFHIKSGGWSLRNSDGSSYGDMAFSRIAVDNHGNFILGTAPGQVYSASDFNPYPGINLQVWSRASKWGESWTYLSDDGEGSFTWGIADRDKGDSVFSTPIEDLGDPYIKKSILHFVIDGLSSGGNLIPATYYIDGGYSGTTTSQPALQSETYNSSSSQAIYSPTSLKGVGIWGTAYWESARRIPIRFDISTSQISTIRIEIRTSNPLTILSYWLVWESSGMTSITSRGT